MTREQVKAKALTNFRAHEQVDADDVAEMLADVLADPAPSVAPEAPVAEEIADGDYLVERPGGHVFPATRRNGGWKLFGTGTVPLQDAEFVFFQPFPASLSKPADKPAATGKAEEVPAKKYIAPTGCKGDECYIQTRDASARCDCSAGWLEKILNAILRDHTAKLRAEHAEEVKRKVGEEREFWRQAAIAAAIRDRGTK